jgi:trehalose 6-phosphate synthase
VQFADNDDGTQRVERSGGGLVTALRDLANIVDDTRWICAASTAADRSVADTWIPVPLGNGTCDMRMLSLDEESHRRFYAQIANPLLWFIQHYLWDQACAPEIRAEEYAAWEHGYVPVNRAFADAVCDAANVPAGSIVMVQDYHFYLVPEMVRARRPDLFLHYFVHIPWPQPDSWRVLPKEWRDAIFRGLLSSDIVAFHTDRYVRNFLLGCQELLDLDVDVRRGSVNFEGRQVAVCHYPISIDTATLEELAARPTVTDYTDEVEAIRREKIILRVDRTDPSKNVIRGFHAFDRMLELHPEWRERVTFLALLQPSRQDVPEYASYLDGIYDVTVEVNGKHGNDQWMPIDFRLIDNLELAVAAYRRCDVLVANSVYDGMNLVAKEVLVVNERSCVLALSENAGAHDELGAVALTLQPFDIEQQAQALFEALTMDDDERHTRHDIGAEIVRTNDVAKWLRRQLTDIELMLGTQARSDTSSVDL